MSCNIALGQTDSISLREVEVTAIAHNKSFKTSTPVQLFTAQQMQTLGIGSITEALKHIAGITVRDYGGAGGMKTVSARGIGARHTAVVYDGMAISDCQTGEIDLSRFDTDNVRLLSFIIGDADNIFTTARNAAAPASLYIESIPDSAYTMAKISVGSWATINPSVKMSRPIGNMMLDISASYLHSDNNYPFKLKNVSLVTNERRHNSRMDATRAEIGMRWNVGHTTTIGTKAYYYDNSRQLPGIVHLYTHDNNEHLHDRNAFAQASVRSTLSSALAFLANAKMSWACSEYTINGTNAGITSQSYWQREYYGAAALLYSPTRFLSVDYSADFAHNNLNTTLSTWNHPSRNTMWQSLSAKYTSKRLTAIARTLYTYCSDSHDGSSRHETKWQPSVSMSYHILPKGKLMARAFWKQTFRMPSFNELYYYHIGSTELKPESATQYNIGIVSDNSLATPIGNLRIGATIDAYEAIVADKIVAIPFNMFVWRMMNVAKVRTLGIDATINGHLAINSRHGITLSANYTLQRAQNRSNPQSPYYNYQIAYTPKHSFATTMAWQNPWTDIAITIDGMTQRWTTNEHSKGTRIDGFAEIDINLKRNFCIGKYKFTATASMLNIANKQYDIVAHYPMPGRSWRVGIEAHP